MFFENGLAYAVYNGPPPEGSPAWDGHRAIWLQPIDPVTLTLTGERTLLVDGGARPPEHPFWIEGPHLFKREGHYYLIAAQGGTNEHHGEVVFRADKLRGPYVAGPNPILSQDGLDPARPDPVANAGHADFVETQAGEWWAVFLGTRPYSPDPLDFITGRETFLLPVTWRNGWPSILPVGAPVPLSGRRPKLASAPVAGWPTAGDYTIVDRFTDAMLSPRWSLVRTGGEQWWHAGGGALAITPQPVELGAASGQPSFVALRQAHLNAIVTVSVAFQPARPGDRAGLAAFQDERRHFFLAVAGGANGGRELRLIRRAGPSDPVEGVTLARVSLPPAGPVDLRIAGEGPTYRFAYRLPGDRWRTIGGDLDGSILSNRVAKGFTGAAIGPAAISAR